MSHEKYTAGLELLFALLAQVSSLSAILREARAEGRDLNTAEWEEIIFANDAARARLVSEIERARTEGR